MESLQVKIAYEKRMKAANKQPDAQHTGGEQTLPNQQLKKNAQRTGGEQTLLNQQLEKNAQQNEGEGIDEAIRTLPNIELEKNAQQSEGECLEEAIRTIPNTELEKNARQSEEESAQDKILATIEVIQDSEPAEPTKSIKIRYVSHLYENCSTPLDEPD